MCKGLRALRLACSNQEIVRVYSMVDALLHEYSEGTQL